MLEKKKCYEYPMLEIVVMDLNEHILTTSPEGGMEIDPEGTGGSTPFL